MRFLLFLLCFVSLLAQAQSTLTPVEKLWKAHLNGELTKDSFSAALSSVQVQALSLIERLRLQQMERELLGRKAAPIVIEELNPKEALTIASEKDFFGDSMTLSSQSLEQVNKASHFIKRVSEEGQLSPEQLKSVLLFEGNLRDFYEGKYQDSVTLYLICRKNRNFPCRFILKDIHGEFVRTESGKLWSLPALAKSSRNLAYNITNGQTPMGLHRMDSVMPYANRPTAFGKFRRVILNWVKGSGSDQSTKLMLPSGQHQLLWWKQASVARDVGRKDLRIHGTGNLNKNPKTPYYPHVPTSGCISTLEGKYGVNEFLDQRVLLDKLMESSQLAPVYRNEIYIKGLLYVLELDNKREAVSTQEIETLLM